MSSILRALKKLEDTPPDENGVAPWQDKFTSQHARHERSRRSLLRSPPVIVAAVAVVAFLGWFASQSPHSRREIVGTPATKQHTMDTSPTPSSAPRPVSAEPAHEPSAASQRSASSQPSGNSQSTMANQQSGALPPRLLERLAAARQQKLEAVRAGQVATPSPPTPVPGVVPPSVLRDRAPSATAAKARPPTKTASREQNTATAPVVRPLEKPVTRNAQSSPLHDGMLSGTEREQATGAAITPTPQVISSSPAPPTTQARPDDRSVSPAPALNRLRDPAIKLQAIAWSSDPDRRMAMINEQILHEGQTIEGYTIAAIGEESVTMRKGNEAWELRYGH